MAFLCTVCSWKEPVGNVITIAWPNPIPGNCTIECHWFGWNPWNVPIWNLGTYTFVHCTRPRRDVASSPPLAIAPILWSPWCWSVIQRQTSLTGLFVAQLYCVNWASKLLYWVAWFAIRIFHILYSLLSSIKKPVYLVWNVLYILQINLSCVLLFFGKFNSWSIIFYCQNNWMYSIAIYWKLSKFFTFTYCLTIELYKFYTKIIDLIFIIYRFVRFNGVIV